MKGDWRNVKYLTLGTNGLTARGVQALVKKDTLQSLKQLSLNDNFLDANSGSVLVEGAWKKI